MCEEMSSGNQKVVRVTCQFVGISPRISAITDCQLVVCGTARRRRPNISHAPSHLHQYTNCRLAEFFSFHLYKSLFTESIINKGETRKSANANEQIYYFHSTKNPFQ